VLGIGPAGVGARHPKDAVVLKYRLRLTKLSVCLPVLIGVDAVACEAQHFIQRVAMSTDCRGRPGRTLTGTSTFFEYRDFQLTPSRQLPGDAESDDSRTNDDNIKIAAGNP
jgi:hypothetical protein